MQRLLLSAFALFACVTASPAADWLLARATKLPTEYTNQESGYFSIVEGKNGKLYIGTAKYGVSAYLLEYDPKSDSAKMVMDVMDVIGSKATGFAAQSKIHTRNNVGESGKIYVGSKQGYPEKGETHDMYPGGYVLTYDPAGGKREQFGIAFPKQGIISVTPDESRGVVYLSTCSDDRPIDHTHFMILDVKAKKYRDLGDMEHSYAFIVLDHLGRAYHPIRGGMIARYDPKTDKLDRLKITVGGQGPPSAFTKTDCIQNWDISPDRKTLWCIEMSTNQLYSFDLTASGDTIPGKRHGPLLPKAEQTDCRAMCVGADGWVWAAVTQHGLPQGALLHLVGSAPGKEPRDFGPVGIANPDFTTFTDATGKPKPWHHTIRKEKDGTLTPWVPMGACAAADGSAVYIFTIAPLTLLRVDRKALGN
jgi:sugar lactone lactonase YvrE